MEYLIVQVLPQFARLLHVPYLPPPRLRFHSERVGVGWKGVVEGVQTPTGGDGRGMWVLAYK
jgi:hypothetical protein